MKQENGENGAGGNTHRTLGKNSCRGTKKSPRDQMPGRAQKGHHVFFPDSSAAKKKVRFHGVLDVGVAASHLQGLLIFQWCMKEKQGDIKLGLYTTESNPNGQRKRAWKGPGGTGWSNLRFLRDSGRHQGQPRDSGSAPHLPEKKSFFRRSFNVFSIFFKFYYISFHRTLSKQKQKKTGFCCYPRPGVCWKIPKGRNPETIPSIQELTRMDRRFDGHWRSQYTDPQQPRRDWRRRVH